MKRNILKLSLLSLTMIGSSYAQGLEDYKPEKELTEAEVMQQVAGLKSRSQTLSKTQDELAADVQELIEDQTNDKVIKLLEEVEALMANVTDNLDSNDTGNETIFHENKIIEKIFEAAKEKSK